MFNQDKYLSVTWLKGGRAYPELDCFGIVNEVRRDLGLHEWPDFAGVYCYSGSTVTHVAVVVDINEQLYVVECNPKTNVTILPLPRFMRRFVKVEFWQ